MAGRTDPRRERFPAPSCLVLLPAGFALPLRSPAVRCALTAPFHPYLTMTARLASNAETARRYIFCGTFPILADGGRYPPLRPLEPGLSSSMTRPVLASRIMSAAAQFAPAGIHCTGYTRPASRSLEFRLKHELQHRENPDEVRKELSGKRFALEAMPDNSRNYVIDACRPKRYDFFDYSFQSFELIWFRFSL